MYLAHAIMFFIAGLTAVIASPQDLHSNLGITKSDIRARSLTKCPKDNWRPLAQKTSWFLPETDEANQDHYEVTHPALPEGYILPRPLLPTNNATIKALYALALQHHDSDAKKAVGSPENKEQQHRDECEKRMQDMDRFDVMCRCAHSWWFQCRLPVEEFLFRTLDPNKYERRYRELRDKLKKDMQVEGMIELGQRLKDYMAESGAELA